MRFVMLTVCMYCSMLAAAQLKEADLIVHHAVIYTVDAAFTKKEAMAVRDGKIVATGSNKDILGTYAAQEQIDARGKAVYPGFIDAHSHFIEYGQSLFSVDVYDVKSGEELVARVQQFRAAHPDMQWITGRGWDQNKFRGKAVCFF